MAPREEYHTVQKHHHLSPTRDTQGEDVVPSTPSTNKSNDGNDTPDLHGVHSSKLTSSMKDCFGRCMCHDIMKRLRNKWGWVVTLATFVLFFVTYGFIGCYGLLYVSLQDEFKSGATATGWVGSLATAVAHFAGPLSNYMVKRLGSARRVVFLGVVCCFIGLIISSVCPNIYFLFGTMGLCYGLGLNMVCQPTLVLIVQYFPEKNSTRSVSIAATGFTIGMLVLSPVINYCFETIGWRATLRYFGIAILLIGSMCAIPMLPVRHKTRNMQQHLQPNKCSLLEQNEPGHVKPATKETKEKRVAPEEKSFISDKDVVSSRISLARPHKSVLLRGKLWLLCVCMFFTSVAQTFYMINYVSHLKVLGVSGDQSAIMITLYASGQIAGELLLSLVADKLPFHKLYIVALSCFLGGVTTIPLMFVSSTAMLNAISTVLGVLRSARTVLIIPVAVETFGVQNVQPITAAVLIAHGIGFIVGAFVMGTTYDQTGNYDLSITICVTLLIMSSFFYVTFPLWSQYKKTRRSRSSSTSIPLQKIEEDEVPTEDFHIMPMPNVVVRVREIMPTLIGSQESLARFGHDSPFVSRHRLNHSNTFEREYVSDNNFLSPLSLQSALKEKLVARHMITSDVAIHTPPRSPGAASRRAHELSTTECTTNLPLECQNELQEQDNDSKNT